MCCKNTFIFLLLSAFIGAGSMYALDDEITVVGGVAQINDYPALRKVVTDNNRKAELEDEIKNLKNQIPVEPTKWIETVTIDEEEVTYTNPVKTTLERFVNAFQNGSKASTEAKAEVLWYRVLKEYHLGDDNITYYVYITNGSVKDEVDTNEQGNLYTTPLRDEEGNPYTDEDVIKEEFEIEFVLKQDDDFIDEMRVWASDWQSISYDLYSPMSSSQRLSAFSFKDGTKKVKSSKLVLAYLKQTNAENENPEYSIKNKTVTSTNTIYNTDLRTSIAELAELGDLVYSETIKTPVTHKTESQNWKDWDENTSETRKALATKQTEYNGITVYKELKLTADIEVTDHETANITWPKGYILDGDYHRIDGLGTASHTTLFNSNEGTIRNAISQDGRFVDVLGGGSVTDCIVKTGASAYRVYDDQGASTSFDDIVEAVYKLRGYYGYSFSDKKAGAVTDANRLYQAQYANATKTNASSFKVNIKEITNDEDDLFVYASKYDTQFGGKVSRTNAVVYIDDVDIDNNDETDAAAQYAINVVRKNNAKITNVAMKNSAGDYVCANAKLTDGKNMPGFYVPYSFEAEKLSYDRKITTNYKHVAVCLPFALTAEQIEDMDAYAYTFQQTATDSKGNNVIRLKRIDNGVAANTPCILVFKEQPAEDKSAVFADFADVTVTAGGASFNKSLFGNYGKYQTYSDLVNQAAVKGVEDPVIYGIQGGEFVKMNEDSHMYAFRSFVALPSSSTSASRFSISFLDEDGNEEVTGIETVNTTNNNTDFKAVGGRNAIEITTGKACDVKVYTLNGALAKTARVEAGTTTLPMSAGMYVVNKTKVIVK